MSPCPLLPWQVRRRSWHHHMGLPSDLDLATTARVDLVRPEGYPLEEHTVQTPDGYLLSVYRIPAGLTTDTELQQAE